MQFSDSLLTSVFKLFLVLRTTGGPQEELQPHPNGNLHTNDQSGLCRPPSYTDGQPEWGVAKPFTILVEGTVGCGKSTLVDIMSRSLRRLLAVPEPVDRWTNVNGTDMLQLWFNDPKRWSGAFHMESSLTRIKLAVQKPMVNGRPALVRIMERSIYSERSCFMEYSKQKGLISDPEYNLMDLWHKFAMVKFGDKIKPDLILFLKTDHDTVAKRIKMRGRKEEANIDMGFVDGINRLHEDWLLYQNSTFPVPAPVMVLNGTLSLADFETYIRDEMMEKIIPKDLLPYMSRS